MQYLGLNPSQGCFRNNEATAQLQTILNQRCLVFDEAYQKARFAHKSLSDMSTSICMAEEMEGQLGAGSLL